jgi:hypothetical protein
MLCFKQRFGFLQPDARYLLEFAPIHLMSTILVLFTNLWPNGQLNRPALERQRKSRSELTLWLAAFVHIAPVTNLDNHYD